MIKIKIRKDIGKKKILAFGNRSVCSPDWCVGVGDRAGIGGCHFSSKADAGSAVLYFSHTGWFSMGEYKD